MAIETEMGPPVWGKTLSHETAAGDGMVIIKGSKAVAGAL
jgi:hypothetical protein